MKEPTILKKISFLSRHFYVILLCVIYLMMDFGFCANTKAAV